MSHVGIFAGTFDPVHNGHVEFAQQAIGECQLDKIIFLPERQPRRKLHVSSYQHRVAMLQLVAAEYDSFAVQTTKSDHFTVQETLPFLLQTYKRDKLYLLVGSDVAATMALWPGAQDLFAAMQIIVGVRADDPLPQLPVARHIIQTAQKHVAASTIRRGQSQEVAPGVRDYITAHCLYGVQ